MTAVLCKVRQCPLRRLSAPDGARATWQGGLLVWPVDKEEPQMMLLQWDRRRRRMWGVFRRGSTWGQHSGQVYLITGVPNSSSQQASTDHGGLYLQWHYPVQHGQLHWGPGKKPFCFSRSNLCSPCKVFTIWLAAVTCFAAPRKAHLPSADVDGLIRWAQNASHLENSVLLQLSMQTVSHYCQGCSFHLSQQQPGILVWHENISAKRTQGRSEWHVWSQSVCGAGKWGSGVAKIRAF